MSDPQDPRRPASGGYLSSLGLTSAGQKIGSIVKWCWQGEQVIQWDDPAEIECGAPLGDAQLNAVLVKGNGALTYNPPKSQLLPAGVHALTVSAAETSGWKPASRTVQISVRRKKSTITWGNPRAIDYDTPLSDAQLNATADTAGTFQYQPDKPTVLDAGTHKLKVVFTPSDACYESAEKEVALAVRKVTPTVTLGSPSPCDYGPKPNELPIQKTATFKGKSVAGRFEAVGDDADAPVWATTKALEFEFIPDDSTNFRNTRASVSVEIRKKKPALNWADPAALTYGEPLDAPRLNATADVPGTFSHNPGAGKLLDAGTHRLKAAFKPHDSVNYEEASVEVQITVNKADPTIDWTPAEIKLNTTLGAAQLNATASHRGGNVAGSFQYNPPSGTAMAPPGPRNLTCDFTPSGKGAKNFNSVQSHATVQVVRQTRQDKALAGIDPAMEDKILRGKEKSNGTLIGAHSRDVLTDPSYRTANRRNNADGTATVDVQKRNSAGGWTPAKTSTLPPAGWDDDRFMDAAVQTGAQPAVATNAHGSTLHQHTVGGVQFEVIKSNTGTVKAAYPAGGHPTNPANFV